jgi:hypothetical protein
MKVNFNSTDLKTIKYQPCEKCIFNQILHKYYCALLPRPCIVDEQVYVPTGNLSDVFNL